MKKIKFLTVILLLFTATVVYSNFELCFGYYGLFIGAGITHFNGDLYVSGRLSGFSLDFVNWFFPQFSAGWNSQTPKLGPLETSFRAGGFVGATVGFSTSSIAFDSLLLGLEAFATIKMPTRFGDIGLLAGILFPVMGVTNHGAVVFCPSTSPVIVLPQFGITYDF